MLTLLEKLAVFDSIGQPIEMQKEHILALMRLHASDMEALKAALFKEPIALAAVVGVIDAHKECVPEELLDILHSKRIHEQIGTFVTWNMEICGQKPSGRTSGAIVKREGAPEEGDRYIQKSGYAASAPQLTGIGEMVCEYIGSNLLYEMLGCYGCSPEVLLHQRYSEVMEGEEKYEVTLLSKILTNFCTAENWQGDKDKARERGFPRFFYANRLLGAYEPHKGNAGWREMEGKLYWTRIDMGKAFSYHTARSNPLYDGVRRLEYPATIQDFIMTLFLWNRGQVTLYEYEYFKGLEFGCGLIEAVETTNTRYFKEIITLSLKNLKAAYKDEHVLAHPEVRNAFFVRMRLRRDLTEERIIKQILRYVKELQKEARAHGESVVRDIFPLHVQEVIAVFQQLKAEDNQDFGQFLVRIEEKGVNLYDETHFRLSYFHIAYKQKPAVMAAFNEYITSRMQETMLGTDVEEKNKAFLLAMRLKNEELAGKMLESGVNASAVVGGKSLLCCSVNMQMPAMTIKLLDRGADITGANAIIVFQVLHHREIRERLFAHPDVDINIYDHHGKSILDCAVTLNDTDLINQLLARPDISKELVTTTVRKIASDQFPWCGEAACIVLSHPNNPLKIEEMVALFEPENMCNDREINQWYSLHKKQEEVPLNVAAPDTASILGGGKPGEEDIPVACDKEKPKKNDMQQPQSMVRSFPLYIRRLFTSTPKERIFALG